MYYELGVTCVCKNQLKNGVNFKKNVKQRKLQNNEHVCIVLQTIPKGLQTLLLRFVVDVAVLLLLLLLLLLLCFCFCCCCWWFLLLLLLLMLSMLLCFVVVDVVVDVVVVVVVVVVLDLEDISETIPVLFNCSHACNLSHQNKWPANNLLP